MAYGSLGLWQPWPMVALAYGGLGIDLDGAFTRLAQDSLCPASLTYGGLYLLYGFGLRWP